MLLIRSDVLFLKQSSPAGDWGPSTMVSEQDKALPWTDLAGGRPSGITTQESVSCSRREPCWLEVSADPISALCRPWGKTARLPAVFWQSYSFFHIPLTLTFWTNKNSCPLGWEGKEWYQKRGTVGTCPCDSGKKQNGKGEWGWHACSAWTPVGVGRYTSSCSSRASAAHHAFLLRTAISRSSQLPSLCGL